MSGSRFGQLRVIAQAPSRDGKAQWHCLCDCGQNKVVYGWHLRKGCVRSCGCGQYKGQLTHGKSNSSEYKSWAGMKQRCQGSHRHYGGRGIKVCERWKHSFENFLADMGLKPKRGMSIERLDTNGNYTPENCCWATQKQQMNNLRKSRRLTIHGRTQTMSEWADETGIHY